MRPRPRRLLLGPLSLALLSPAAQGAAFAPGAEADPPTGAVAGAGLDATEPLLMGKGIVWRLAPWRTSGTMAVDLRALRLEDGQRTRQTVLLGDVECASYIWQPWFVQLRAGLGGVASAATASSDGSSSHGASLTGHLVTSVFPASRFPFELRADVSDSRSNTSTLTLGNDYRSQRLTLSQGYRPPSGNDSLQLQLDESRLSDSRSNDKLTLFSLSAQRHAEEHTLELGFSQSDNRRTSRDDSDIDEQTRLGAATARHGYHPSSELDVQTLASWNELRLHSSALDVGSEVRQISSFASWRPSAGLGLVGSGMPMVAATARWVQSRTQGQTGAASVQGVNGSLGLSQDLSDTWRMALSANANQLHSSAGNGGSSLGAQATLSWQTTRLLDNGWRYAPSASANGGYTRVAQESTRSLAGAQFTHSASKDLRPTEDQVLGLTVSQSAAVLHEAGDQPLARALAHSASVYWQEQDGSGNQGYGGLSLSDSRSVAASSGSFQLVNLQFSRRSVISRQSSWSTNLTLQASHNRSSEVDVFTGQRRDLDAGWQRYYTAALSYEHQRAFGVPRLRHSVLFSVNSQPLERRALGDIDAPRERVTASLETRLDYAIGRLETRLSARVAQVDGRVLSAMQARAQRNF